MPKSKKPQGLMNPDFKYRNSANTNVQETWKRFGWNPPSEIKEQAERAIRLANQIGETQ